MPYPVRLLSHRTVFPLCRVPPLKYGVTCSARLLQAFNCLGCPLLLSLHVFPHILVLLVLLRKSSLSSRKLVYSLRLPCSLFIPFRSPALGPVFLAIQTRFSHFPLHIHRSDNMVGSISQQYERKHKVTVVGSGNWYVPIN